MGKSVQGTKTERNLPASFAGENLEWTKLYKDAVVKWKCRNCGYVHEGKEAPDECPACAHPQAYYELLCENY